MSQAWGVTSGFGVKSVAEGCGSLQGGLAGLHATLLPSPKAATKVAPGAFADSLHLICIHGESDVAGCQTSWPDQVHPHSLQRY